MRNATFCLAIFLTFLATPLLAQDNSNQLQLVVTCRGGHEFLGFKFKRDYFQNHKTFHALSLKFVTGEFAMLSVKNHFIGDVLELDRPLCENYKDIEWIYDLALNSSIQTIVSTDVRDEDKKVLTVTDDSWTFTVGQ